ncbi:Uncharacterised protein [Yersinia enterocolitica]|nr:Uncharacterised protein [Yersinia enterocolitica]
MRYSSISPTSRRSRRAGRSPPSRLSERGSRRLSLRSRPRSLPRSSRVLNSRCGRRGASGGRIRGRSPCAIFSSAAARVSISNPSSGCSLASNARYISKSLLSSCWPTLAANLAKRRSPSNSAFGNWTGGIVIFIVRSMFCNRRRSRLSTNSNARPARPARPVRPIRWT